MFKPHFNFRHFLTLLAIVSFFVIFSPVFTGISYAANGVPRTINFQGRLVTNPGGVNVANGTVSIVFSLYNNASGGTAATALWSETQSSVTVTDGIFRVVLGSQTPIPANFNFNWDGLYLGVNVAANGEMTPRIQMASVPFAFNAQQVAGLTVQDTSGNASTSGTLQVGNATTVNTGLNNLTFSTGTAGSGSLTINSSGATSVTMPTGGILLTNTASANQTITSSQTSGNVLSIADTSGTGTLAGISFNLSGSGTTYDLLGTGSTWSITKAGALTVASCSGCGGGTGVNWWNQLAGALSPIDVTNDFLLGSTATSSALFSYTGIQSGQTIASASGNLIVMANNGWGGKAAIGYDNPGIAAFAVNGNVGIGTTSPAAILHVSSSGATNSLSSGVVNPPLFVDSGSNLYNSEFKGSGTYTGFMVTNTSASGIPFVQFNNTANSKLWTIQLEANKTFAIREGLATGQIRFMIIEGGNVGIGTTSPTALLHLNGGYANNAALIVNNLNSGNLFVASASGTTKFIVGNSGALSLVGGQTSDLDTLTGTTLKIGASTATTITLGRSTQGIILPGFLTCTLKTDGSGVLICGTDQTGSGGSSPFAELTSFGTIVPNNSTEDFLIGGQATTSAKFAVLGVNTGNTVASVSGNFIVMPQNGWGGQVGIGVVAPREKLHVVGNFEVGMAASGAKAYRFRTNGTYLDFEGSGAGMIYSTWSNNDFTGTHNYYLNLGNSSHMVIASGDWKFTPGNSCCSTTGNPLLSIRGESGGNIGIGTENPLATLDIRPTFVTNGGTIAVASVSGATSFAGLVVDNSGVGDLFTASASGATRFVIANSGDVAFTGAVSGVTTLAASGAIAANGGITFDQATDTLGAFTMNGNIIGGSFIITDIGSTGTDFNTNGGLTITLDGASTGLVVNNSAQAQSIFIAQDNGTPVFTIADGGDITWAAATPTITINAAETFTISNGTAADNFVYNTSTNALTIGDGTNGLTFDIDTGMTYQGTGRLTKRITLTPEYAGATFTADGTNNTGSMTSDNQAVSPYRNFYKWTNTQGTAQDYDIWVTIPLPADYSAMAATPTLSIDTYSSDLTNGTVLVTVYDTSNVADCTSQAFTPTGAINTWESKTATTCLDTGTYAANGVIKIDIHVTGAATTGDTRVSTIYFDYLAKF